MRWKLCENGFKKCVDRPVTFTVESEWFRINVEGKTNAFTLSSENGTEKSTD